MRDVIFVLTMMGFFAICVAYVGWCNRFVGHDDAIAHVAASADVATDTDPVGLDEARP